MSNSNAYLPTQPGGDHLGASHEDASAEMKLWSWKGRLGRLRFLAYSTVSQLVVAALAFIVGLVAGMADMPGWLNAAWLLFLPYLVFIAFVTIRRSHDMGWSGWMSLLAIIPLVGLIWVFKAGNPGANAYGAPPPPNTTGVKIGAFALVGMVLVGIVAAITLPAYQQYVQRGSEAAQKAPSI